MNQTLDQQRAAAALQATPKTTSKEYRSLVAGAGAHIMQNGLGQTVAFYDAKARENRQYRDLLKILAAWLLRGRTGGQANLTGTELIDEISNASSDQYRALTAEALAYMNWLKRIAEARAKD